MTARPVIAIAPQFEVVTSATWISFPRNAVQGNYVASLERGGATPLLLPLTTDREVMRHQMSFADGLLLAGGPDPDPVLWGATQSRHSGDPEHQRDAHEWALLEIAEELALPVLGICRGEQMLNIFHGGTLIQDLPAAGIETKHALASYPDRPTHSVSLAEGSFLRQATGSAELRVNSFHHQAVDQVAPGWTVTATAPDGVVEAIERQGEVFGLGVQWHPEHMSHCDAASQEIFTGFVRVCASALAFHSRCAGVAE